MPFSAAHTGTVDLGRIDQALLDRLKRRSAAGPGDRVQLDVIMPFSGESLGSLPAANGDDVRRAAKRARAAQTVWARVTPRSRARRLIRLHDLLLERREEALDLIQLETGEARIDAFKEIEAAGVVARYYGYHGPGHLRSRRRRGALPFATRVRVHWRPKGVVGVISPWNFPLSLGLDDVLPALAAGNGVVFKPDPQATFTGLWCAVLADEAGIPPDLFQVVPGDGARIGADLIEVVDYVVFTGSTPTGRIVGEAASRQLTGCTLELGGKNSLLVLDDAHVQRAVAGAVRGAFSGAGQLCMAFERVLVHRSLFDDFVDRLVAAVRALRVGSSLDFEADMGSLASAAQLDRVQTHVDDALAKGATAVVGGRPLPALGPWFFAPTVLLGVRPEMTVHDEETFGPILSVYPFDTDDEAVELANATRYGLSAGIYSRDVSRARRLAGGLRAGTININEAYAAAFGSVDAPMGGFKDSGLGRRHGREGIRRYTEAQTVADQRWIALGPTDRVPNTRYQALITFALKALRRTPGIR